METTTDHSWNLRIFGHDRALVRSIDSTTMAFGLGPPRGTAKDPSRLATIIGDKVVALRYCHQVHGRAIHRIEAGSEPLVEVGPGDGLMTAAPGVGLLVWTADCVPVLLAAEGAVVAVHSGWRGCAADIVGAAIERLGRDHRISPEDTWVALGPAVCGGCYEVGPEVLEALRTFGLDETRWRDGNHFDLRGFLTARLEALGVPAGNIETVGGCTVESPELASFRRDGEAAGRQWSMVFLNL